MYSYTLNRTIKNFITKTIIIMQETFEEIKELFESMEEDADKWFNSETKAAAKRLRKNAMEIKKLCHRLRQEISGELNS